MRTFLPWKISHYELSKGLLDLDLASGYGGHFVVFWWHGVPLGHKKIPAVQLPISATELSDCAIKAITPAVSDQLMPQGGNAPLSEYFKLPRQDEFPDFQKVVTLERPMKQLRERWSKLTNETVNATVAVVICTRDRPEQLLKCLNSLNNLSKQPQEIIVVDNAPDTDATRRLLSRMSGVLHIREPRPGLSAARNTGIRKSNSDIIAFTDDDVMVHPDWIIRLTQSFQNPDVMCVTGLVLPVELETESQVAFEIRHGYLSGAYRAKIFDQQFFQESRQKAAPVWEIGAGANMAFRRQVFEHIGFFDERLGVGAAGCSEDSEIWYRILAKGWSCRYEPTAVVYHRHRRELKSLKRQLHLYMRGHVAALMVQFSNFKHRGNLRRLFLSLPKYYLRLFFGALLMGFRGEHRLVLSEITGCIAGIKYYFTHRS
jgi:GT2 family glycosyltransferase